MRKPLKVVSAVVAVIIVVVAGVLLYAAHNLNSIIAERQPFLLARISDALGRQVEVSQIKVVLGWGVIADLAGVKIQDDPAISGRPFIEAGDIYAKVDLLPLLSRHIHVTEVALKNPEVRIIRTEQGGFNVSTIGARKGAGKVPETSAPENPRPSGVHGAPITAEHGNAPAKRENLGAIYVNTFVIEDGVIVYEERGPNHQTVTIKNVDVSVEDFSFVRAFDLSLKLAMLSDKQNVAISGSVGPLAQNGVLAVKDAKFNLKAKLGPMDLARLRAVGSIGKAIPEALSVPDPVALNATAAGTLSAVKFHVESDLTGDRVAWANAFDKPASVEFKLSADGSQSDLGIEVSRANLKLSDLDAKAANIGFGGGKISARIDTNRFDIGSLVRMTPALQKYNAGGQIEIHSNVKIIDKLPQASGTVTLAGVSLSRPEDKKTLVDNLSGELHLSGNSADAGPLKFDLGGGHATLTVHAASLQPINASYNLSLDTINVATFAPNRPPGEHLSNVAVAGTASQTGELAVNAKVSSSEGNLADVAYKDLDLSAAMLGKELHVQSLKLGAFNGTVEANGTATLGDEPQFALNMRANNVDIQSALQSQQSKSAGMIRGILNAQLQVSGRGAKFDAIKPTLAGRGRAAVQDGKLVGVNLAADALRKTKGLPGIGDLVPEDLVQRHPELFNNPDTEIQNAGLTFVLQGPRITTHDLVVQTPDYGMTGDGSFDLDKNIDMGAHLLLSKDLTKEFVAEKKNVVYVTNKDGQIDIPFSVHGKLPKPMVIPDIAVLAQRAASQALQQNVTKLIGKKGKGLGIPFISGGGSSSGGSKPSGNPLEQLKGLFH